MCFQLEDHVLGDRTRETRRVQIEHSAVRLRILNLTNRFITDVARLDADTKAQVLRVFDEWEQTSIARSIDPNWGGDKFWDLVTNEAPLTDWLFKISDCLNQHFICRDPKCTTVIHNCH